jgi:predicted alpha-1,2-mannosidase
MKQLTRAATLALLLCLTAFPTTVYGQDEAPPTQHVDPFIGTDGSGHVFPGASLPFGMVKLGPDMGENNSNSGYVADGDINGFSHVHVSGTGGGAKYGNILAMPFTGTYQRGAVSSPGEEESAAPGHYSVNLSRYDIGAELTATRRVGYHRYTFPESDEARILIDAGHFLSSSAPWNEDQKLVGSEIEVVSDRVVQGYSRVRGGWNKGGAYTVYFYAKLSAPVDTFSTWKAGNTSMGTRRRVDTRKSAGAVLHFQTNEGEQIGMKVGISFVSTSKARQNLASKGSKKSFEEVRTAATKTWRRQLAKIGIETESSAYKEMFYTALYHSMLMPTDRTGENPEWTSEAPYYDDYYAIWDTFRTLNPLLTLISPSREVEIVQSLIDIYEHDRYLPDARSGNANGRTQGGSNADVVIADAHAKGLESIDYETALQGMLKNAEQPPGGDQQKHGRGGLSDYKELGYVSTDYERAGTRTMEYAYNDFAIAETARRMGRDSLHHRYIERSHNWKNLWNPSIESAGATGFIWPRKANGSWVEDFSTLRPGSWPDFFYESHSWEYSLYVPHDVAGLIEKSGGREAFIERLNTMFLSTPSEEMAVSDEDEPVDYMPGEEGAKGTVDFYYNPTNEPGFLSPALYIWAGRPDLSNDRVRSIINEHYGTGRDGLPGNDDSGAISSWMLFHMMGFFPIAGQDLYVITAPHLPKVTVNLENGRRFVVEARGLSEENQYVTSATLNGEPLDRAWFRHTSIKDGGRLVLEMGPEPSGWGTENPPPSLSER